ncbi:MAG TPA: hypothetical protein VKE96_07880 [Vicinamibacterales bacterium]|nr:hypothetical protein [Vicinamibacterales bacterium]
MRRLFSNFATGQPGVGLLVMRLVAGGVQVFRGVAGVAGALAIGLSAPVWVAKIVLGLMLIIGLWTPVTGGLVAVLELGILLARIGDPWIHVLLMTLSVSLALMGPGGWSVDARLFGWKRIDIGDRRTRSSHPPCHR